MQSFAIIPAAGRSSRMGRPKLLLPWRGATLIEQVIGTWRASRADRVIVVVHPLDTELAALAASAGADVVAPAQAPAEMKVSIQWGLDRAALANPASDDAWLVAPADMPGLTVQTIDALLSAYADSLAQRRDRPGSHPARIWVPRHAGKRGHPVLFPWSLAGKVSELPEGEGLKSLVDRHEVVYLESGADSILEDLDTPADYERLRQRYGG